ncbi:unnamed protein product, partial [Didymodactylos carnosus]
KTMTTEFVQQPYSGGIHVGYDADSFDNDTLNENRSGYDPNDEYYNQQQQYVYSNEDINYGEDNDISTTDQLQIQNPLSTSSIKNLNQFSEASDKTPSKMRKPSKKKESKKQQQALIANEVDQVEGNEQISQKAKDKLIKEKEKQERQRLKQEEKLKRQEEKQRKKSKSRTRESVPYIEDQANIPQRYDDDYRQPQRQQNDQHEVDGHEREYYPNQHQNGYHNKNERATIKQSDDKQRSNSSRLRAKVVMLDDTEELIDYDKNDIGKDFYNRVCDVMRLEEKDYFGLMFLDSQNMRLWLNNNKRVRSQLKGVEPIFYFRTKFYPPEPALLQEDLTRYQLCLQLRHDILSGKLPCSFVTYALLGSYTAQAELGDYSEFDHGQGYDYLRDLQFAPTQDDELLRRIAEQHKRHKGQAPNGADLHFLENAKKLAMYGVDIHHAQDSENVDINIGVSANGLLIYRDKLRINRFAWPKILKISYKRKYFYIKLRPGDFDRYESTIGFKLPTYKAAKTLWKIAVEHHAFFRLRKPEEIRKKNVLPRFNSTFRYTGTYTYHQARQLLLERPAPDFERSLSKRMTRSLDVLTPDQRKAGENYSPNRPQKPVINQNRLPDQHQYSHGNLVRPTSVDPLNDQQTLPRRQSPAIVLPQPNGSRDDYLDRHNESYFPSSRENVQPATYHDPEYAHVSKPTKPTPSTLERDDKKSGQNGIPPELKPKRPPVLPPTYANVNGQDVQPSSHHPQYPVDHDEALLTAIRLATDLDPNMQVEKVVITNEH